MATERDMQQVLVALSSVFLLSAVVADNLRAEPSIGTADQASESQHDAEFVTDTADLEVDVEIDAPASEGGARGPEEDGGDALTPVGIRALDDDDPVRLFVPLEVNPTSIGNVRIDSGAVNIVGGSGSFIGQSVTGAQ